MNAVKDKYYQANSASFGYSHDMRLFKHYDYRCLKPKESIMLQSTNVNCPIYYILQESLASDSSKWPHYDMKGFRAAKTEAELKSVREIRFNKLFFNFEDPDTWKKMMNPSNKKHGLKLWRQTYGFDFASYHACFNCRYQCIKEEFGKFATNCRNEGGFFKCCVRQVNLRPYENIRYELKKQGLIESGPSEEELRCPKLDDNCYMCLMTYVCTKKDPFTGGIIQEFKTSKTIRENWKVGGSVPVSIRID